MSFFGKLFGSKSSSPVPPPPATEVQKAPVRTPAASTPPPSTPSFESPLEAFPGVAGALAAYRSGDRSLVTQLYRSNMSDSGLRLALVRELAEITRDMPGPATPLDAAVNNDDPLWQIVRGYYHIRVGWDARGGGTADTVSTDGWNTLGKRCELAVEDLEDAATALLDDELPLVCMMHAARGLSDRALGRRAYEEAIGRNANSWAAAQQRVEFLSPRWFGSIDEVLAYGRAESARVGTGELAAVPLLAINDVNFYHLAFKEDREAASELRHAVADEVRDCVARSVDAPNAVETYSSTIIRHFAGALLWQVADEAAAKALLSKVGNTFEPWCWMQNPKAYASVRSRLGL